MTINDLSENLITFFVLFDSLFLDDNVDDLLKQTEDSLKNKVLKNESALPIILAIGWDYDSSIDKAKIEEVTALRQLIKAKENLKNETLKALEKANQNKEILSVFGVKQND